MKRRAITLTIACVLFAWPGMAHAKGGGHSGGHAATSHGSGGHRSGGHSSSTTGKVASQNPSTSPHRTGSSPTARGRTGVGAPAAETAVPRPATLPIAPPTIGVTSLLPAYPLFGLSGGFGLSSFSPWPIIGYANTFGAGDAFDANGPTGGLRLRIEPASAEVFVDGEDAGVVDDFNGRFHHLNLAPGPHHLEVRAPGYAPLFLDVVIQPHHTIEYKGTLAPSSP